MIQNNPTEGTEQMINPAEGRTFTQDDVNRIVGERLAKEKAKTEQELSQRETELSKRELMLKAKEMMMDRNMPVELLEAINYTDEKTLNKSLDIIYNYINSGKFAPKLVGVTPAESTRAIYRPVRGEDNNLHVETATRKAMGLR